MWPWRTRRGGRTATEREKCSHPQKRCCRCVFLFLLLLSDADAQTRFLLRLHIFLVGVKGLYLVLHCNLISCHIWETKAGFPQWVTGFGEAKWTQAELCMGLPLDSVPRRWNILLIYFRDSVTIQVICICTKESIISSSVRSQTHCFKHCFENETWGGNKSGCLWAPGNHAAS